MKESQFQAKLISTIRTKWPSSIVLKNDPNYKQGIPDLLILYNNKWAALECKQDAHATHQPNQDYYVEYMNNMAFAKYIYPENQPEVLSALEEWFNN